MPPKKRKADDAAAGAADTTKTTTAAQKKRSKGGENDTVSNGTSNGGYEAMTLSQIKDRIVALMDRVPSTDDPLTTQEQVYTWAATLQAVIEEFNLLVCLISSATYKWGSDRSGAADQNLSLLSGELQASQEQITSTVTPRLTNILAPVVDLVIDKSIITTQNDDSNNNNNTKIKTKQNVFTQKQVDPDFLDLCRKILGRNAVMIRQVVLSNFWKVSTCIGDYLKEQEKEHDSRGGYTY